MSADYHDRWIDIDDRGIAIRGYYIPWGTKRIPYAKVRSVAPVKMSAWNGRARIWGTANPTVWASLDPGRPGKRHGFLVDSGHRVRALITPGDATAAGAALAAHLPAGVLADEPRRAPLV